MKNILLICLLLGGLILPSCENNEILLSEKKLKSELQGTWKIVSPRPIDDFTEFWNFSGGTVSITSTKEPTNLTVTGTYSVDAKFSKAYISLGSFSFANFIYSGFDADDLNRRWTLVELNDGVLYLSATDSNGAIRSIEFVKQ
jgi:hypothetical protein